LLITTSSRERITSVISAPARSKRGEKYNIQTIKDNGEIYTWKAHLTCLMVVRDADYDDGLTEDDFRLIVMEDYAQQGKCLGCPHKDDKCAEMQSFEECLSLCCKPYL
jgi:hypothetical protein